MLTPILILGMHRSGTSCLAGSLQARGLESGSVNEKAGFNKKGNRETLSVVDIHEAVLQRLGAAWDRPLNILTEWTQVEQKRLQETVWPIMNSAISKATRWGVKAPRILAFYSGWKKFKPDKLGTFRRPISVANSLTTRDQVWDHDMDMIKALDLWVYYNNHLLKLRLVDKFPVINFESSISNYKSFCNASAEFFGIEGGKGPHFRDESLKQQALSQDNILSDLKVVWDGLREAANWTKKSFEL